MDKSDLDLSNLKNYKVAIIDDVIENIKVLSKMLRDVGFSSYTFQSGQSAIESLSILPPDIILLDINMPEMDGYETAKRMKKIKKLENVPIIFISALNELDDKLKAFSAGGVDYITKPFVFEEVKARVETHAKIAKIQAHTQEYNKQLEEKLDAQYKEAIETQNKLIAAQKDNLNAQFVVIEILAGFSELESDGNKRNMRLIQKLAAAVATELSRNINYQEQINEKFITDLVYASALYDVGMIAFNKLLANSTGFKRQNKNEIEEHTAIGAKMLYRAVEKFPGNSMISMAVEIAQYHHERFDGSGYPSGLKGNDIPLSARIISVVDTFEMLMSQEGYTQSGAVSTICNKGMWRGQFEDDIVNAFANVVDPIMNSLKGK